MVEAAGILLGEKPSASLSTYIYIYTIEEEEKKRGKNNNSNPASMLFLHCPKLING